MPGSRLTYRERRQITIGLTDGLTYAEIARQLDRPTSTVSREVTRNGGPEGYRAEPAQRSTTLRARRRPPAQLPADRPDPGEHPSETVREVAEQLAALLVRMGLSRMAARVFGHLCVSDADSLTAAELVRLLRVSPASVSKAVRYLTGIGMLLRDRDGRRERYRIGRDVWVRVSLVSVGIEKVFIDVFHRGAETLGVTTPAGARLADMAWCFEAMYSFDTQGAERLSAAARTPRGDRPAPAGLTWPDVLEDLIPALNAPHPCPECGASLTLSRLFRDDEEPVTIGDGDRSGR